MLGVVVPETILIFFFSRNVIQSFRFVSKTLIEHTDSASRQSVAEEKYVCHVYIRDDKLGAVLVADHDYPPRVAYVLITKVLDDFTSAVPMELWSTGSESSVQFETLNGYLDKYQNPSEADVLTKLQVDLNETEIVMKKTIEAVLVRGTKISDLITTADKIANEAKSFGKAAEKTNACCRTS